MPDVLTISRDEILHQVKISCQIPTLVQGIVTYKILSNAAREKGITVETEELQQAADNLRLAGNLRSADATWTWMEKHCLSLDDFEELVYATALSSKLAQHFLTGKVEPFFVEHQLDYVRVVMYEIILDDEDLAMELFYSLQEGEINFHEVAHQYIQDKELRRAGGYRGALRRSDMKPEISAAVFAATPPQILKPIVTSGGAHLILVEEIVQPQLDSALRSQIISDLFSVWLREQMEQVEIVTKLD